VAEDLKSETIEEMHLPGGTLIKLPVGTRKLNGDVVTSPNETHRL